MFSLVPLVSDVTLRRDGTREPRKVGKGGAIWGWFRRIRYFNPQLFLLVPVVVSSQTVPPRALRMDAVFSPHPTYKHSAFSLPNDEASYGFFPSFALVVPNQSLFKRATFA